jgi:beta-galactosidase beta subunit
MRNYFATQMRKAKKRGDKEAAEQHEVYLKIIDYYLTGDESIIQNSEFYVAKVTDEFLEEIYPMVVRDDEDILNARLIFED